MVYCDVSGVDVYAVCGVEERTGRFFFGFVSPDSCPLFFRWQSAVMLADEMRAGQGAWL